MISAPTEFGYYDEKALAKLDCPVHDSKRRKSKTAHLSTNSSQVEACVLAKVLLVRPIASLDSSLWMNRDPFTDR
jgi:hypothetical protein